MNAPSTLTISDCGRSCSANAWLIVRTELVIPDSTVQQPLRNLDDRNKSVRVGRSRPDGIDGNLLVGRDLMRDGKRPKGWQVDRDPGLLETNVPGIFVVGDVRHGSVKRVASGVGEGSVAISFVHQYLSKVV